MELPLGGSPFNYYTLTHYTNSLCGMATIHGQRKLNISAKVIIRELFSLTLPILIFIYFFVLKCFFSLLDTRANSVFK